MKHLLYICVTCFLCFTGRAATSLHTLVFLDSAGRVVGQAEAALTETTLLQQDNALSGRPHPLLEKLRKKQRLNKKITAAVLAFPFPFGMVGLHRIYMGTKPYVPVVYIATAGGVFGILPFIDFCVLMFDKDFDRYKDNGKVFMWVKD